MTESQGFLRAEYEVNRDLEMFEFLLEDLNLTRAKIESAMDAKKRAKQEVLSKLQTLKTNDNSPEQPK